MDNTKIDWCDMSWNPITGCRHGCEYCYARRIAERFNGGFSHQGENMLHEMNEPATVGGRKAAYPFGFDPTLHRYRLGEPARKQRPRNIFVGSMADVFGAWVPLKWEAEVLDACRAAPQHNYLFLTKNPQRYLELDRMALLSRESNFWYGTTITGPNQKFFYSNRHKVFLSVEPLMERLGGIDNNFNEIDWVIIGAMTGPGAKEYQPQRAWVEEIVEVCWARAIPVFMKDNLAKVWGPELIREFPPELRKEDRK